MTDNHNLRGPEQEDGKKVTVYTDKDPTEAPSACETASKLPEVGISIPKSKKERKKKLILTAAFVIFNLLAIGFVLLLELKKDSGGFAGSVALKEVMGKNIVFLIVAFGAYLVHVLCDAIAYFFLIKQCGYGNRPGLALRVSILGKYYDNVTPSHTGGQPFQMAYMVRANIDMPTACSLPIVKYAIRIFFVDAVIIGFFIFVKTDVSPLVIALASVGMFGTTILPLLLVIFSGNVEFLLKVTKKLVGFLHKIKLVKNYDKVVCKAQDTVDSFLAAFKYLGKHKLMIIIIGLVSVVDFVALSSIPFFIIKGLGGNADFFQTITKTFYVSLSSGIMPTPGASGAAEGAFYGIFGGAVPQGYLFWAVLFWRIAIFYLPIALGIGLFIFEWVKGKTKVMLVETEIRWMHKKTINKKSVDAETRGGVSAQPKQ
ncbi:MAG TPA: lysylphosphatidylglycerol synthase transmembrane domain-containing protein [Clostridia bacterium]|nr:lysylphosphatidylglycerol synthase transmembrane domain-containing protein [Clostridia bacterium]HOL60469.1 lysylphosphatidylglycerol synthase transmembrane domain-containing protein [Clostridia bacterium]HPO53226.1 lysylphosphatidylglycerol synthase transmembrane domain-containing protein [Clostridia bacterium]